MELFDCLRCFRKRRLCSQVLSLCLMASTVLMTWKGLMVATHCESPIIVLYSDEDPNFQRGSLLLITNYQEEPVRVGEIVVFKVNNRDIPIVHRVVKVHEKRDGSVRFLTKGDDNVVDDRGLYAPGQLWLEQKDIIGRVKGYIPYVGLVAILISDIPGLKYTTLAGILIWILRGRWLCS